MLSRKLKYGTSSIIIVLIVLGIIAVINFLSTRHFVRADLTETKDFTISDSTKKVLRELDDIVNINAYFSKDLPPYLVNLKRQVQDIFDEYKAYSRGNIMIEFIDPTADQATEQKVRFMGIPQAQLNIIERDKAEVVNVYLGIAVLYEDRKEVIPLVRNVMTLEYDLTSAIVKVTRSEPKTVGFLTGHGEYTIEQDYEAAKRALERQYNVVEVDISEGKKVPESVDTLIVAGPKEKLSERDKYEIDQFLMRGGKIIFLIDLIDVGERGLVANEIDTGLNDMLEHYGVKLGNSLVLDRASNANASFSSGFVQYSLPYPFWPRINKQQFSKENPAVNQLESLILPWSTTVELLSSKVKTDSAGGSESGDELRGVELFKSSQYSWTKGRPFQLAPQQRFIPTGDLKEYPMGVAVTGSFKSFYADKPVPQPEPGESSEETPETEPSLEISSENIIKESPETQMVVIGNAKFITNGFLSQFRSNGIFLENIVDWLTLGRELISIRSRSVTDRPLKETSENMKLFIRIINIAGAASLVVIFGLVRLIFRRRAKKVFETYSALGTQDS
jgi:gliding-associated putative ABC transporter substrate-binding component GldG